MKNTIITAASLLAVSTSGYAATTGLLDLSPGGASILNGGSASTSPKMFDATTDFTVLDNIAWSSGSESGTFDLSFTATSSNGVDVSRGGKGAFGIITGDGSVGPLNGVLVFSEGIELGMLVASDFTGDLIGVTDLAFNAIYLGNGGESPSGAEINSVSVSNFSPADDTTAGGRNDITAASSANIINVGLDDTVGDFSINGIDITFTAETIPEPSSSALLGLGACAFILRRKR